MAESQTERSPLTRFEQAAGFAGLLFAVLMTVILLLFNTLQAPDVSESLLDWLEEDFAPRLRLVSLYLAPFTGIAFLWFMAAIRERGGIRTDRFFDTLFLGSGLLFIAMLFGGAAAVASIVSAPHLGTTLSPTDETIRIARLLGYSFFNIYAARTAGVFTMVTSGMLLRSSIFPKWVGFIGVVIAFILLLGTNYFRTFIYLFPGWIALVSMVFLVVLRQKTGFWILYLTTPTR